MLHLYKHMFVYLSTPNNSRGSKDHTEHERRDVRCATEVLSSLLTNLGIVGITQIFLVDSAVDLGVNLVDKLGIFAESIRELHSGSRDPT